LRRAWSRRLRAFTQATTSVAPTITATPGHIVTGAGFLSEHLVTIRVTYTRDDITDYLTYTTDPTGHLNAALPKTRPTTKDQCPGSGNPRTSAGGWTVTQACGRTGPQDQRDNRHGRGGALLELDLHNQLRP
jgi:hypothetical protein